MEVQSVSHYSIHIQLVRSILSIHPASLNTKLHYLTVKDPRLDHDHSLLSHCSCLLLRDSNYAVAQIIP